jgi:hypothetical protein
MAKKQKKCFNFCPNCGADENQIVWGDTDSSENLKWQNGTCNVCNCNFEEMYEYTCTEYDPDAIEDKTEKYPVEKVIEILTTEKDYKAINVPEIMSIYFKQNPAALKRWQKWFKEEEIL